MRTLLLLSFGLAWTSACVGCGQVPAASAPHRELAARLEAETVALVKQDDEGRFGVVCAGVWVSPTAFLTAGHCVATDGEPEIEALLESLGAEFPEWSPVGQREKFATQGDIADNTIAAYWTGKVVAFDKARDLALVAADPPRPAHSFARLSQGDIEDGDRVEWVGHPATHVWSYAEGYVSAVRMHEPNGDRVPMATLQIAGPVSHGNSGGGALDAQGQLIGIASYTESNTNGMAFFVHRDALRVFLHSAGVA